MLRKIEYLIPAALSAIDEVLLPEYQSKGGIPKGYQGAASGLGTTLIQMGLMPTLAVYTDKDNNADINRQLLLRVLLKIVKHEDSRFSIKMKLSGDPDKLLKTVASSKDFPKTELKEKLMEASLAFKLAIRTYKLKD